MLTKEINTMNTDLLARILRLAEFCFEACEGELLDDAVAVLSEINAKPIIGKFPEIELPPRGEGYQS